MDILRTYRNKPVIKVLTGLRRSGKSSLLQLLQEELLASGIPSERILSINFDNMDSFELRTAKALHDHLKTKMQEDAYYYVLLDEVQESVGWEHVVNSLLSEKKSDIYLTGSNSQMLSSDLATYIAGRYIEIPVSTLSFAEALAFRKIHSSASMGTIPQDMNHYIRAGGFPAVYAGDYSFDDGYRIVKEKRGIRK